MWGLVSWPPRNPSFHNCQSESDGPGGGAIPDSPTGDFQQNTHLTTATARGWVNCTVTADTSRHTGASRHLQPQLRLPAGFYRSPSEDSVCSSAGLVFIQAEFHSHTPDIVCCVLYCYTGEEPPVLGVNFTFFWFPFLKAEDGSSFAILAGRSGNKMKIWHWFPYGSALHPGKFQPLHCPHG